MTLQYTLDENDFLTHQLYIASKSERIRKIRKRSRMIVSIAYAVMALLFYIQGKISLVIIFLIIALCWFIINPFWERKKYVRHYKKFIAECYKIRIGRTATLTINNECFVTKDDGGESKIIATETEEIVEIPSLFLIRLKSGQSLLIPKNKISNADEVKETLIHLAGFLKINYKVEDNWKWR
jgi:hypothetical protein